MSGPISSVGPYKVERELGRGGMGVVYLGMDSRLDRLVAIKALPETLAGDEERMARLEREAKILAALNHTNIAGIYGYEEKDGAFYLVLEFVEGPTLAERLAEGPMGVREALELAAQIASGIAAAHEAGVVHRDLKPGNIKIASENRIKILDFGLAKMAAADGHSGPSLSQSPTKAYAETRDGVVLGTAGYMSPEQARGKVVDRRTDLWALGCILFEMLTGRQAFRGETISDTLAAVLRGEPDWALLPTETPAAVRRLLRRCLEKDARKRIRDASDARIDIEEALNEAPGTPISGATAAVMSRGLRPAPAFLCGVALLALGALAGSWIKSRSGGADGASVPVDRVLMELPEEAIGRAQFSPDGRTVAYVANVKKGSGKSGTQIFLRPLDSFQSHPLPGTEGARGLGYSHDGKWIYYGMSGDGKTRLFRTASDGSSPPVQVDEWTEITGASTILPSGDLLFWLPREKAFFFLPVGNPPGRKKIPLDLGDLRWRSLDFISSLPGEDAVLANIIYYGERGFVMGAAVVDLSTGKGTLVLEDGGSVRYHRSGHLLFTRGEVLLAVPFDLKTRTVKGTPVALERGLRTENTWAPAIYTIGPSGSILYAPGGEVGGNREVVTLAEGEAARPRVEEKGSYIGALDLSPDGRSLAVVVTNEDGLDEIWLSTEDRPALRRFVAVRNTDLDFPMWTPDGKALVYQRTAKDAQDGIYLHPLDGAPTLLLPSGGAENPYTAWCWTPGGDLVVVRHNAGFVDPMVLPKGAPAAETSLRPLFPGEAQVASPAFSPDGKWVAYLSGESDRSDILLAGFREGSAPLSPRIVSDGKCRYPFWSRDGKTLYFAMGWKVMQVAIGPEGRPSGAPRLVTDLSFQGVAYPEMGLRVSPEGRLLYVRRGAEEDTKPLAALVLHWDQELKRLSRN